MEFIPLQEEHLNQVLRWRTQAWVTRYMFTDLPENATLKDQTKWFAQISQDATQRYWIIIAKGRQVGVISVNDIDHKHHRCSWAFYIGEQDVSMLSMLLAPYVYRYVFEVLKFNKISGEVMAANTAVRKMHMHYGCKEVGCLRDHIYKYDTFHDVYTYELLADEWFHNKSKYGNRILGLA
ncbi:UDP-4-amino-4,6-dideoxy-N-acetyl-beta-L-altrosamine N-acetyltransferase [Paenibacillus campi]|uniref:UDP-4-amino-4, 6-dideoxy-N-acetyl-beta-L-altrosamine N-acetyltransferase n=1 Tax=Paenibacillus campi TaxID=3106031 RepID=UPI002AFF13E2|nr:UDP-4-amino-4,6-dideoxy-N-acetyl-beta-L-altrosamine N-acetyltransferase [Paenibacillus sp. SGZ-1009]